MATKKEDAVQAEFDLGRKAYADATRALRNTYREEFNRYLDEAYEALGAVSPRKRRAAAAAAAAEEKAAAAVRREERRLAKIAKMEAELAALKGEQTLVTDAGDPIF